MHELRNLQAERDGVLNKNGYRPGDGAEKAKKHENCTGSKSLIGKQF